jgi:hypothetical protein
MTRRLQSCRFCKPEENPGRFSLPRGFTRHRDRICSRCRGMLRQRQTATVLLVPDVANVAAPTMEELARGIPVHGLMPYPVSWRGRGA